MNVWRVMAVGLLALGAMVALFAIRPGITERLELTLLDWRFRLRGPVEPEVPIDIIAIDGKSLDEFGRWPWRRSVMAGLIDRLTNAGVAAIGVDVVFAEPETPPEIEPLRAVIQAISGEDDQGPVVMALDAAIRSADTDVQFEQAIARSERTVLGFFFRTGEDEAVRDDSELVKAEAQRVRRSRMITRGDEPADIQVPLLHCVDVEPSLDRFNGAAERMGFVNALKDADGAVRRAAVVADCAGALYPALSIGILEVAMGRRAMAVWGPFGLEAVQLGDLRIPTDSGGKVLVNYLGPPKTFPTYSASDVFLGRIPDDQLEGHIVIIGPTEIGVRDTHATPFSRAAPGVEVHATLLHNYLTGSVLDRSDTLIVLELAAVVVSGLLLALAVPLLGSAVKGAFCAVGLMTILVGGAAYAFVDHGIWFNMAYPGLTIISVYVATAVTQSRFEEAESRRIRGAFATYVPPEVVKEMVEHPDSFKIGGDRKDISLLFSDIRSFTTISEELGPEGTTALLNAYLTPMTKIIFDSRGTLDKYIGDAVVAFWGAPLPVPDHPVVAARAAVAMQDAVRYLRGMRHDLAGAEKLKIGIGIHSAEVNVGNMGSELRFDYTVTGDGVNLCARLEGMTKYYGAEILTSGALVARLPDSFLVRELDSIRVKGKHDAVKIYEVLGEREVEAEEKARFDAWAAGLEAYRAGRWDAAESAFREARELHRGSDVAADMLLDRLEILRTNPPEDWEGVWAFETK